MDEFQRFRNLIAPPKDSEEGLLSQRFLQNTCTKVLLLSATPYKPYSTLEEIAEDESADHYHEFMEVMDFLFNTEEKQREFHTVWEDYSSSLCELREDTLTVLRLCKAKERAQNALYQGICRTERFNTGIFDDSKAAAVKAGVGDILSYDAMQSLLEAVDHQYPAALRWKNIPVDYVKSCPYLLSFMENYQLKKQLLQFCARHPEFPVASSAAKKYLLLKRDAIHYYREIPANNVRLETLKSLLFKGGACAESLLWVPASHPYYTTGSIFDKNKNFSKDF